MPPVSAAWTEQEDELLRKLVAEYGPKKWSAISNRLKTKGSKQCRRRWKNYLNADLKTGGWTPEEDRLLMDGHNMYGNKWTEIAKMVGGRTDNAVKNRWAALCKRDKGGGRRGPAAGGATAKGGRRPRASDSDGSDGCLEEDSDGDDMPRRSSSFSSDSRDQSPLRGGGSSVVTGVNSRSPFRRGTRLAASVHAERTVGPPPENQEAGTGGSPGLSTEGPECGDMAVPRNSTLGRRRLPTRITTPESSEYIDTESDDEAAPLPAKRRAVLVGGEIRAVDSESSTPRTPRTPGLLAQLHEAARQHCAAGSTALETEEVLDADAGVGHVRSAFSVRPGQTCVEQRQQPALQVLGQGFQYQPSRLGGARGHTPDAGPVQPKKLPLTISIPNAASAEPQPQPLSSSGYPIEIHVLRDLLTPCEIQYARELNEMQLALHIKCIDSQRGHIAGAASAAATDRDDRYGDPPLSTSRQAAQDAVTALITPGSTSGAALADFSDVLKWFQTGLTPRSTRGAVGSTPHMLSRTGLTPCGISSHRRGSADGDRDSIACGMLGTGLTPTGLSCGSAAATSSRSIPPPSASDADTPPYHIQRPAAGMAAHRRRDSHSGDGVSPSEGAYAPDADRALDQAAGAGSGAELHEGHRQLLAKLIQGAAAAEAPAGQERLSPPSSAAGTPLFSPSTFLTSPAERSDLPTQRARGAGYAGEPPAAQPGPGAALSAGGISVYPQFTQQELQMLLEVLGSELMQDLPPPPLEQ